MGQGCCNCDSKDANSNLEQNTIGQNTINVKQKALSPEMEVAMSMARKYEDKVVKVQRRIKVWLAVRALARMKK